MSDANQAIGTIHTQPYPRDAVHIAVVQIEAGEGLMAGDHVSQYGVKDGELIGIVDPFIIDPIAKGDKFYLFLYPNSVTDLVHHYTHPVLDATDAKVKARQVVLDWIESWNFSDVDSRKLYEDALHQFKHERPFDFGGRWRNEDDDDEGVTLKPVYDALETLTGKKATEKQRNTYYSCCI